jgi:hypothetical protein
MKPDSVDVGSSILTAENLAEALPFAIHVDESLPPGTMIFRQGGKEVGRIVNIGDDRLSALLTDEPE